MSDSDLNDKIAALQARYLENLPERRNDIATSWAALSSNSVSESLSELHNHYHKLAGSAGMYGFETLSVTARKAEIELDEYIERKADMTAADLERHQGVYENVISELDAVLNSK